MQLTGTKFTESTALAGNDLSTLPDFPAEIRAPAGTMAGVSGFQIHFSADDIRTPADHPDVLVAFNPAALRANVGDVRPGGMVIVNSDAFTKKSIQKAGYADDEDPIEPLRDRYNVVEIPVTTLNREAIKDLSLSAREGDRSKNFFCLGLMYWLYNRPVETTVRWLETKFKGEVLEANVRVLKAGYAFGETTELFPTSFIVPGAKIQPGTYRNITGNTALAWGVVAGRRPDEPQRVPRRVSDHAGERRAARGRALPPLRREDVPGRGRDRRDQRDDRRCVSRAISRSRRRADRAWSSSRRRSASR